VGPLILLWVLAFTFGWLLWDRSRALLATLAAWSLLLLPYAAYGGFRDRDFWLVIGGSFVLSILLTELGVRGRDRYQAVVRRFAKST
jgi:hypothetical protein